MKRFSMLLAVIGVAGIGGFIAGLVLQMPPVTFCGFVTAVIAFLTWAIDWPRFPQRMLALLICFVVSLPLIPLGIGLVWVQRTFGTWAILGMLVCMFAIGFILDARARRRGIIEPDDWEQEHASRFPLLHGRTPRGAGRLRGARYGCEARDGC